MIGPAVAGIVIVAVGTGWVFVVNAFTFIGMLAALVLIRTDELIPRVEGAGIRAPRRRIPLRRASVPTSS